MFRWLKQRLIGWVEEQQRREIGRLRQEAIRLKEELERETGQPIQLSPEDRRMLAEKAKNIDLETLKQISVFDPESLKIPDSQSDSAENP